MYVILVFVMFWALLVFLAWFLYRNVSLLEIASLGVMYLIVVDLLYLVTRHEYAGLVVGFLIVYMIIYSYSKNKEE